MEMRALAASSCLLMVLFLGLILLTPIGISQNEPVHISSLDLYVGWSNEPYVRYRLEFKLSPPEQDYYCAVVLVPFPTDRILYCPDDVICAWQNVLNELTSVYLVIPPNRVDIMVEFQSAPIIISSPASETRKFVIDFNFTNVPSEIRWLMGQNGTVVGFDEVRVTFPFTTSMTLVDDTPSPTRIEGQSRVYNYRDVMTKGGTLTIRYPSPQSSWLIWGETALAGSVGCATAFVMYIATDDERITRRRKAAWATIAVLWTGTFVLTPMWIIMGEWPWNIILPIWISCVANTIVVTPWVRILRKHSLSAPKQTLGT